MKIAEKTFVSLSYTLTVDGNVVETVNAEQPMSFLFGMGQLLPAFEANIINKEKGEAFAFTLEAKDAYGEKRDEYIITLPKEIFMQDGVIPEGVLIAGNRITLNDPNGNIMPAVIVEVQENGVVADLNSPMAGKDLSFEGTVVDVREATDEDFMAHMAAAGGGGCNCSGNCGDGEEGCGCGSEGSCCS